MYINEEENSFVAASNVSVVSSNIQLSIFKVQSFGLKGRSNVKTGMIDSGANTCGSPTFVAKHYNLEIFQGKKLSIDSFNGTSTTTTSYANFGPILGVVPVSDEFEEFILAECILTKQGINLFKYKEAAILLDPDGSVLCTAPVNRLNNFHYVQLDDLIVLNKCDCGSQSNHNTAARGSYQLTSPYGTC